MGIKSILLGGLLLLASVSGSNAQATDPSLEEVRVLTLKAAELLNTQGIEAVRVALSHNSEFVRGAFSVNVIDSKGTWLIYPLKSSGARQNITKGKDPGGIEIGQSIIRLASEKGEGWFEYPWLNRVSGQIQPVITFVKAVPSRDAIVYASIFK